MGMQMALIGAGDGTVISIANQNINAFVFPPGTAEAGYRLGADGNVYKNENGVFTQVEVWCTPTGNAPNYEAFVTVTSGVLTSGPTGSWVALSSTRDWVVQESVSGAVNVCDFTVQIRKVGTSTTLDTANVNLAAGVF